MSTTIYVILYDYYDRKLDRRFSGIHDLSTHTYTSVVDEIANGYVTGVQRVYECVPGGECRDITAEIAESVCDTLAKDQELVSYALKCWLHQHHPLGVVSTHGLVEAA
jgi:hypothetical protein